MIVAIGLAGLLAFVVASLAVGSRILLLAMRTRRLPEIAIGGSLVLSGGLGTALSVAPNFLAEMPDLSYLSFQLASLLNHAGWSLMIVFVWRVFRRGEVWAVALFGLCILGFLVGAAGMALELHHSPEYAVAGRYIPNSIWFWCSLTARCVGYGWAAFESFRYCGLLKKRITLGLSSESVASRFYYWGVCTSSVLMIWINLGLRQVFPHAEIVQESSYLVTALLGFAIAGSVFLAFFPRGVGPASPDSRGLANS